MEKLKKIAKIWVLIALFMLVSSFAVKTLSHGFYLTFIAFFIVSAIFVLLGWDKYITYGDETPCGSSKTYEEDADDWQD